MFHTTLLSLAFLSLAPGGCGPSEPGEPEASQAARAADERIVQELRRFEGERRAAADFERAPPSDHLFGPDPYVIRALAGGRFVGLLRGADAVVLLDGEMRELARADAPASASGLALDGDTVLVVGERASVVRAYRAAGDHLEVTRDIPLPGARALRDVAVGPGGVLHVVEEAEGRLLTLVPDASAPGGFDISSIPVGAGPFRVARTASAVVVACLIAHTVSAHRVDAQGRPTGEPAVITNDGPLWSFAALEDDTATLLVASGGVENRRLDRTHGSFENIDSFVYLDRISWPREPREPSEPRVTRVAEVNVSEHGVVVPKAVALSREPSGLRITAAGHGSGALASITVPDDRSPPTVTTRPIPPGTSALARDDSGTLVLANPLLDAWIVDREPVRIVPVPDPRRADRTPASRLGEALIFTTLIAPWNRSNGPLSRFTCETCHFEGYGDGRTHSTGRGDIRATTKPLLGLFNNRPHFSRALDPDLSTVAHAEFRVAGARSDHDPVFDLTLTDAPWLAGLGVTNADLSAVALRRAFMTFLMEWSHRTSALTTGRAAWSRSSAAAPSSSAITARAATRRASRAT